MGLLWGNDKKICPDCGMEIPDVARVCPYCHKQLDNNTLFDNIHSFGCLGFPLIIILIIGVFALVSTCS